MDLSIDPPPSGPLLRVLVVCGRQAPVHEVRGIVAGWPRRAEVHWTPDPLDAVRIALDQLPQLAIVDARIDRVGGRALSRQLARWSPGLEVFAFDERDLQGSPHPPRTWHWSELPMVLTWWARRHPGLWPAAQLASA